jgi:hypothetical protein
MYRLQVRILDTRDLAAQARQARGRGAASPAQSLPASTYVADIRQGGINVYDSGIPLGINTDPLEVVLHTNGGTVEGTVAGVLHQGALEGTVVALIPPETRRQNPALYRTSTDARGEFVMNAIPPGPYKLFAWENIPPNAQLNPDFLKRHEHRGVSISVQAGATVSQDLVGIPAEK